MKEEKRPTSSRATASRLRVVDCWNHAIASNQVRREGVDLATKFGNGGRLEDLAAAKPTDCIKWPGRFAARGDEPTFAVGQKSQLKLVGHSKLRVD